MATNKDAAAEARFLESFRQLPSDRRRAAIDCIKSMPAGATADEKVRRLCLAISGYPRAVVDAIIVQEPRASFRAV
jgi:hypothetical protein